MVTSSVRCLIRFSSFVLVCESSSAVSAQTYERLSGPLPATPTSVERFWTGPGTTDVFYVADQLLDGDESPVVYRAAEDGSGSSSTGAPWQSEYPYSSNFTIAPGGEHLVEWLLYSAYDYSFTTLYSWERGVTTPVVLSQDDVSLFRITADGTQVVFIGISSYTPLSSVLWSRPIDGSSPLRSLDTQPTTFEVTPDGQRVVYAARNAQDELRCVPVDDSQPPLILDVHHSPVGGIQITPDGSRALYYGGASGALFSVPLDASAPTVQLSGPQVSGIRAFQISPDGTRAVYLAYQVADQRFELFEVPVDGRSRARRVSGPFIAGGNVQPDFRISGDSKYVVYRADASADEVYELYSAALGRTPRVQAIGGSASSAPRTRKLNPPLATGGDVTSFRISPDGSRVAYLADGQQDERFELFGVPIDGSATAVPLSGTLVSQGDVQSEFVFSGDGKHVAYRADQREDEVFELFGAPSDGSAPPWCLSKPMVTDGDVLSDLTTSSDGTRVLHRADVAFDGAYELYCVPFVRFDGGEAGHARDASGNQGDGHAIAPATRVNDDLDAIVRGGVGGFEIAPDSEHVLYRADGTATTDLYSVDVARPGEAVRLNSAGLSVRSFSFSLDSSRALYLTQRPYPDPAREVELYSAPVDGRASPIKLSGTLPAGGDVSSVMPAPLGRALYIADQDQDSRQELYSVPVDGSLAPVKLNNPLASGEVLFDVVVPASGTRAAFRTATNGPVNALFGVPIDGSGAAVRLTPPFVSGGSIYSGGVGIDPGGTRAVYVANQDSPVRHEIYSVPLDGSAGVTKLNGTFVNGRDVGTDFDISPDGSRVLYRADQDTNDVFELFSVPIDGSAPATKLNPVLVAGGDVWEWYGFSPDGTRVAYVADQDTDGVLELYSVPSDGSAPAVKLNGPLVLGGMVSVPGQPAGQDPFAFSSDGSQIVYLADAEVDQRYELYSVPSAGGAAPVKISASTTSVTQFFTRPGPRFVRTAGSPIEAAALTGHDEARGRGPRGPGSGYVLYLAPAPENKLFLAPMDGSSAPVQLNGSLFIYDYPGIIRLSTDGSYVAYAAVTGSVFDHPEIYRSMLP